MSITNKLIKLSKDLEDIKIDIIAIREQDIEQGRDLHPVEDLYNELDNVSEILYKIKLKYLKM